jgi:acyl-CoA thioesterase-1
MVNHLITKTSTYGFSNSLVAILSLCFVLIFNSSKTELNAQSKRILFYGDSITAGYGLDKEQAFPAIIQNMADSLNKEWTIINGGLSGETSAGGLRRINWVIQQPIDVFILELGGNDGLRGMSTEDSYENLSKILATVKTKYPNAKLVIAGMQMPPNMGERYTESFSAMYPKLAEAYDAYLIPFILEDVGGIKDLNQADGIHPTAEGHRIIATNLWEDLIKILP